jgi:urease accessory protein
LEWLPAETIVYSGSLASSQLSIHLAAGAKFVGWEVTCLGRPASNSPFDAGHFMSGLDVTIDQRLELSERLKFTAAKDALLASWGLGDSSCFGTLLCASDDPHAVELSLAALREVAKTAIEVTCGVTSLQRLVVLRVRGPSVQLVHHLLVRAWKATRPLLLGHLAHEPRIWST